MATLHWYIGFVTYVRGQFPIPSASIGKIHSSSLTSIRITLQWDPPVCLYTIPSIAHVFIHLIIRLIHSTCGYLSLSCHFERIAYTTTFGEARHYMYMYTWQVMQLKCGKNERYREPNVWLHSSVGTASHRYRGGHGFESRWSLDFFLSNCLN